MRRLPFGVVVTAAIALSLLEIPHAAHAQRTAAVNTSSNDSLGAQLVELELRRGSASTEDMAIVSSRIAAIHAQLRALPDGGAADRLATTRVILALDARSDTLDAQLRRAGVDVVSYGNAPEGTGLLDSTRILVRRGNVAAGERVRRVLKVGVVVLRPDSTKLLDASVLLGADFTPRLDFHP